MQTGRRAWQSELSTVDSGFLLAGALTAGIYFDADTSDELEIRTLADELYRRADWQWAQNAGETVTHGWKSESGFLKYRWEYCYGYDFLFASPLFTHQLSHTWIDFRGIRDAFMREKGIDYFENSHRATYGQ